MHEGIDIGAGSGTPIRAAAAGTVIHAGWLGGYGNLVVIDHGGGVATAYGHQSSIAAGSGAFVAQGQVIGYVGSTGNSTGPHLHFEVRVNGAPQDPLGYLSSRAGSKKRRQLSAKVSDAEVPVALVEVEAVADEELVGRGEADVANGQVVHEPPVRPVEQRHDGQRPR